MPVFLAWRGSAWSGLFGVAKFRERQFDNYVGVAYPAAQHDSHAIRNDGSSAISKLVEGSEHRRPSPDGTSASPQVGFRLPGWRRRI